MVDCTCKQCGKVFAVWPANIRNGRGKYCSRACYDIGQRTRVEKTCLHCGNAFMVVPQRLKINGGKYCSLKCSEAVRPKKVKCICKWCGVTFELTPSLVKAGGGKHCSVACNRAARENFLETKCQECGKVFKVYGSRMDRSPVKFCSRKCACKGVTGEKSPFWKGGHSDPRGANWKQQRELARERDGDICQLCGQNRKKGQWKYPIHHIKPYREFDGDYLSANDLSNLITLCRKCHAKVEHGILPVQRPLL